MNLNSREICGLNIKPLLIDVAFDIVAVAVVAVVAAVAA